MKKKILSFMILMLMLYISIPIVSSFTFVSATDNLNVEIKNVEYINNVSRSVELKEQVVSNYKIETAIHNDKEYTVYNDDFAGVFIDEEGILNIAVVGEIYSNPKQESLYNGQVIYKQFVFSYNYLQRIMNAIEDIMDKYSINAVGIDDKYNHVFVELIRESDVNLIFEYLVRENLYEKDALRFEIDAGIETHSNTAFGGERITQGPEQYIYGTLGVNAICNITGKLGILTNEHVAPLGVQIYYRDNFNSTNVALGTALRTKNGGTVDASFVPFTNQEDWAITPYGKYYATTYTNVKLGNESQIISGQQVLKIGQSSTTTYGELRSTNVSILTSGTIKSNLFRYTNDSLSGDSGGPVYYYDGTNYHLLGLHFAGTWVPSSGRQGVACRISNIMTALDVTPITNDTFNTTNLSSGEIQLDSMNINPAGKFVIPESLHGRTVTSIGNCAFFGKTQLSQISIPNSVTYVGPNAFENCTSLTNVTLPNSLTRIGDSAFKGCTSLSNIKIPKSVTNIDSNAFENCTSLTNVTLPNNLTRIGDSAFKGCTSLSKITIPNSVTDICSNSFENCTNLESVTIQRDKDDITSLGLNVFTGCKKLKTIKVPTNRTLEYMKATNWSSYSHLIIIDSYPFWLRLNNAGGKTNNYQFEITEDNDYHFYHNCVNPVELKITDSEGKVLLYKPTWYSYPIFINLEKGKTYTISLITTNDEDFNINIDKVDKKDLEIEKKYYETLNRHSFAYYSFESIDENEYTINSTITGARTNMWLYDTSGDLVTYDYGDDNHNGAKITTNLAPSTIYIVILYIESGYSSDDYTIQFYKTSQEVYHLDWNSLPKQYFDPMTYDYANFVVFSRCYDLVIEEETKTITFGRIECFWDVTYSGYPYNPQEYVIGMMIGISYDSFEKTLPFFSFNGFYEERSTLPYTYSYSATVTNVSITFSNSDWANYVSVGPR